MTLRKHFAGFAVTALAAAIPAVAMADVSIYGRAHVSVDFLDDGADYSETNLSSNSSRLGFKGDHEINPNLTAFFQIEQQIDFGTDNGSSFNTRDTFVGLKGSDGPEIWKKALSLGAVPESPRRAIRALEMLADLQESLELFTYPAEMGEEEARACGFSPRVIGAIERRVLRRMGMQP